MKVLLVNSLFEPYLVGGAERSTLILAKFLVSKGIDVVVLTTDEREHTEILKGMKVYYVRTPNIYWVLHAKKQPVHRKIIWHTLDAYNPFSISLVKRIVDVERIDIMHTNNLTGFSTSVWSLDVPKVHTIRDLYLMCIRSTMFRGDRECRRQCLDCYVHALPKKLASSNVDAVVGISRYILEKHSGYFPNARMKQVIYNPIEKLHGYRKKKYPPLVFGFVGMLAKHKGIEIVLKLFKEIATGKAKLKVFGRAISESYEAYLKERYASENVEFMGYTPPESAFSQIHVLIVPSLSAEAFGRVVVEAYSFGIPAIVSSKGGLPEIVVHGETGFVFSSFEELKTYVKHFLEQPKLVESMGRNALEYARNFLPERTLSGYLEIYDRLM